MQDAASERPVCGDTYASMFMDAYGRRIYDKFVEETVSNACIIVRHRIIDDIVAGMLGADPALRIVSIGAGFDSRPYRLAGGNWIELDEPQVMAYKNARLPASACTNPLRRIAIDFCAEALQDKLAPLAGAEPTLCILEGIFIYLEESAIRDLLATLHALFPRHHILCDLVSRDMVENYGLRLSQIAAGMGALFKPVDHPESVFLASGYQVREAISIMEASADLGLNALPKSVLRYFFEEEIRGNAVYLLEKQAPRPGTI